MYRKKTVKRAPEEGDGKRWFVVDVTETYSESVLVRALDEEDACEMVHDLVSDDKFNPTERGEYDRSVDPHRPVRQPSEGEEYWEDEDT